MYNRYIPSPDGSFRREIVTDPPSELQRIESPAAAEADYEQKFRTEQDRNDIPTQDKCEPTNRHEQKEHPKPDNGSIRRLIPAAIDTGDLLVLMILLLLLVDGDEDDTLSVILTIAAFILL